MERLEKNRKFWTREETDSPSLAIKVGTFSSDSFRVVFEDGLLRPENVRIEDFLCEYDRLYEMSERIGDDLFAVAVPFWGIPWMEAMIGCPVRVDGQSGSMWSEPRPGEFQPEEIVPASSNPWLQTLLEFVETLVRHARGRYVVSLTLMRGPLDMVAGLVGHERMCTMAYDDPEQLRDLLEVCASIWLEVASAQFDLIPSFRGGYCCGMRRVWAPGKTVMMQDDASILISPRIYDELVLDSDRKVLDGFDYSMMHLHSAALHVVDALLEVEGLKALEVDIDPGGPSIAQMIPTFRRIQQVTSLHLYGTLTIEDVEMLLTHLGPRGLCLELKVATMEEGQELLAKVREMVQRMV